MSSDEDKMKISLNKDNNDKEIDNKQTERLSLIFVDSIFKDIQNTTKEVQDPLNTNNLFYIEKQNNKKTKKQKNKKTII